MYRRLLLLFFTIFLTGIISHSLAFANSPNTLKEGYNDKLVSHYIIAFDQSVGKYRIQYLNPQLLSILDDILNDNNFDKKKDYLSVVGYTLEAGKPSMERFVRPFKDSNGDILWIHLGDRGLKDLFPLWPQGQPILDVSAQPYGSMQSLAKPYAIMETVIPEGSKEKAEKTILLIVSDEVINGIDDNYAQEWKNLSSIPGANYKEFKNQSKEVFDKVKKFNEDFNFIQIPIQYGDKQMTRIGISNDSNYKIIPYELISTEKPSVHSVTDLPSPLPFKRVKGGYALEMDSLYVEPNHTVEEISILTMNGDTIVNTSDLKGEFFVPSQLLSNGDSVRVHMNIALKDGMYNGMLMTPDNYRYPGLENRQKVRLANDYQILGFIPLADWMWPEWWSNDMFTVILVWDILILLVLIIILYIIGYKALKKVATYTPQDRDVKIHHL